MISNFTFIYTYDLEYFHLSIISRRSVIDNNRYLNLRNDFKSISLDRSERILILSTFQWHDLICPYKMLQSTPFDCTPNFFSCCVSSMCTKDKKVFLIHLQKWWNRWWFFIRHFSHWLHAIIPTGEFCVSASTHIIIWAVE